MGSFFTVEERDRIREHVLAKADADRRIVAGAVVGSMALTDGDRWSDLDLTFAVAAGVPVDDVLGDWTRELADELDAVHLFDLPAGATIYRVFLLPGCLQVDLSFTLEPEFRPRGPRFRLLFGSAGPLESPSSVPASAHHLFGLGVHHALRARFCIERGRHWQAEHWIAALRECALALACLRHGLDATYGRGFDDLPAEVLEPLDAALVRSVRSDELFDALRGAIDGLLREAVEARDVAERLEAQLLSLTAPMHHGDTTLT